MEHVHINAASAVTIFLAVVVTFGLANVVAMRFRGHPAADAWLDLYGHGA
jgi:hypothetical protein